MLSNILYITMNTRLLFPHRYRLIGWLIFIPMAVLGTATLYVDYSISWLQTSFGASGNNFTNELAALGVIAGLLLIAFSEEETEDEMSSQLRLEALQWSVFANYLVLAVSVVLFYDLLFFNVLVYNMFTVLLVFIARFRWLIYKNDKLLAA